MNRIRQEADYLENVLLHLENSKTADELEDIREELLSQGLLTPSSRKRKKQELSMPHHYVSSDGYDIYIGKNNTQNDELTLKSASRSDIWLHAQNIPGSHVIIRTRDGSAPDRTVTEAAALAAIYSKARWSSKVSVDYTQVKYVKKPKGARPGMVIYDNFKTVVVEPDQSLLRKLATKNQK